MTYPRKFTEFATDEVQTWLSQIADRSTSVESYRRIMTYLGCELGKRLPFATASHEKVLIVATSEDADYLVTGYINALKEYGMDYKLAIFWNHHYSLPNGSSVAPITQRFIQNGFDDCSRVVILKSIVSGSCVIRTNLIALLDSLNIDSISDIIIVAPVMYNESEANLKRDFPEAISSKFKFQTFAIDSTREKNGIVLDGIGEEVYERLGLENQPALMQKGYMPELVAQYLR